MTEKTQNERPEGENAGKPDFDPVMIAHMFNANGVHEGGVHGSVLSQTRDLVEAYIKPEVGAADCAQLGLYDIPIIVSRAGVEVMDPAKLEPWATAPRFRRGTANMLDITSFIGHVNRYKDDHTIIFANNNRTSPTMTAVLDYHEAGAVAAPRFGKHRTHYAFPLSDQWIAWTQKNGVQMEMADFAAFLEDHVSDVLPPEFVSFGENDDEAKRFVDMFGGVSKFGDPAKLMQISTSLHVNENSTVSNAQKLASGESNLVFTSEHETSVTVPALFAIGIPIFKGDAGYRVIARLRYRKVGARLVFWYELWRTDIVFDHAFNGSVEKVQAETGLTVWLGSPEASA